MQRNRALAAEIDIGLVHDDGNVGVLREHSRDLVARQSDAGRRVGIGEDDRAAARCGDNRRRSGACFRRAGQSGMRRRKAAPRPDRNYRSRPETAAASRA